MKTYHNVGTAGREYSRLNISNGGTILPMLMFEVEAGLVVDRPCLDVGLNATQVQDLVAVLNGWLKLKHGLSDYQPLFEGSLYDVEPF